MNHLVIAHLEKGNKKAQSHSNRGELIAALRSIEGFFVETCQRVILIPLNPSELPPSREWQSFAGIDAYEFLLRVATGLESQVLGETDVFGQIKTAFKQQYGDGQWPYLQKILNQLFQDAKEIRAEFLEGIGGNSYGSLCRKLLGRKILDQNPSRKTLLIGAGSLAESVAPFFKHENILIWNRSRESLDALTKELLERFEMAPPVFCGTESLQDAWDLAEDVIVAIPNDAFVRLLGDARLKLNSKRVLHLGARRNDPAPKGSLQYWNLDDLFEIQDSHRKVRSVQVKRAEKAIEKRAFHRSLGNNLSTPHGWEDLFQFEMM